MENITSPPMQKSSNADSIFNPLLISMLGIVATSIAIVLYHMLLVKYCIRRHGSTVTAPQPAASASGPTAAGIDEKVLKTIPIFIFSAVRSDNIDIQDDCVVCLGELEDGDEVRLLPNCEHAFHVTCIDQWFAAHASCPLCRSPILEPTNLDPSVDANRAIDGSDCESGEFSTTNGGGVEAPPPPRAQSFGLLRHCPSLVLHPPAERRASPSTSRLKRSQSMDQLFVAIDLQSVNFSSPSSSPCSRGVLTRSGSYSTRSNLSHFDRVSSKLRRSFSRLSVGKAGHGSILPY